MAWAACNYEYLRTAQAEWKFIFMLLLLRSKQKITSLPKFLPLQRNWKGWGRRADVKSWIIWAILLIYTSFCKILWLCNSSTTSWEGTEITGPSYSISQKNTLNRSTAVSRTQVWEGANVLNTASLGLDWGEAFAIQFSFPLSPRREMLLKSEIT